MIEDDNSIHSKYVFNVWVRKKHNKTMKIKTLKGLHLRVNKHLKNPKVDLWTRIHVMHHENFKNSYVIAIKRRRFCQIKLQESLLIH